jgi:hypothetical protein
MRRPVFVIKKEFDSWRRSANGLPKKGGRPPHDWNTIEKKVVELMDYHGDFSLTDPDWNAQARLEDRITDEFGIGRTQLGGKADTQKCGRKVSLAASAHSAATQLDLFK